MSANSNASLRRILDIPMSLSFTEFEALNNIGAADLAKIDGITNGTAAASKALVLNSSSGITTGLTLLTATTLTGTTVNATTLAGGAITNTSQTLTATSASTDAGTSVEPFVMGSTMTGAGGVGGRARFQLNANAALGGWSNALKGITVYNASGKTTGLGSAIVAEMTLSAGTADGTYAPFEAELNLATGALTGTQTSFMYMSVNGDDASTFDTNGGILSINGITIGSGKVIQASAVTDINSTHAIRIFINGTAYYIPAHTAADFGG